MSRLHQKRQISYQLKDKTKTKVFNIKTQIFLIFVFTIYFFMETFYKVQNLFKNSRKCPTLIPSAIHVFDLEDSSNCSSCSVSPMEMGIVPPPRQPNPVLNDPQFKHAITPSSTDSTSLCSPSPTDGFILV